MISFTQCTLILCVLDINDSLNHVLLRKVEHGGELFHKKMYSNNTVSSQRARDIIDDLISKYSGLAS